MKLHVSPAWSSKKIYMFKKEYEFSALVRFKVKTSSSALIIVVNIALSFLAFLGFSSLVIVIMWFN